MAYVLDVDLRKYFDTIDHAHLRDILRQRVGDGVIRRLIHKWLKAGVWEDGQIHHPDTGSPQGGVISPLLSNIYLHTVLDDWYVREMKGKLHGKSFMVRYADDFVMGFSLKRDALAMLAAIKERFAQYGLQIHPEKTQLVGFKRPPKYELDSSLKASKPESFDFLGFTHYWGKSRKGNNVVQRKSASKRFRRTLKSIKEWGWAHRHESLRDQQEGLNRKLQGHYSYYGICGNSRSLSQSHASRSAEALASLARPSQPQWTDELEVLQ